MAMNKHNSLSWTEVARQGLQEVGLVNPTPLQLHCLESTLTQAFQFNSIALLVLERLGITDPLVSHTQIIAQTLQHMMRDIEADFLEPEHPSHHHFINERI